MRFRAISSLIETVLRPEYNKYAALLEDLVEDIITDLIDQIHEVKEDEAVVAGELAVTL